MIYKSQVIVFVVSFLIVGFFVLSAADEGFSQNGPLGCCAVPSDGCDITFESVCDEAEGVWCEGGTCEESGLCRCPVVPPQIPTLNQWGMIIMAGLLGLMAIFFVTRRLALRRSN